MRVVSPEGQTSKRTSRLVILRTCRKLVEENGFDVLADQITTNKFSIGTYLIKQNYFSQTYSKLEQIPAMNFK